MGKFTRHLTRIHLILTVVWALLAIPTVLLWKESVPWVNFLSLYSNFAGHFTAYHAADADFLAGDKKAKKLVSFHKIMTMVWALMFIPNVLWLQYSISWTIFMSLYANFVGEFGAYQASRAEDKVIQNKS